MVSSKLKFQIAQCTLFTLDTFKWDATNDTYIIFSFSNKFLGDIFNLFC